MFGKLPKNTISQKRFLKFRIGGFYHSCFARGAERVVTKSSIAKHYGCKRERHCGLIGKGHSVRPIEIFICKKYNILLFRSLRSNKNYITIITIILLLPSYFLLSLLLWQLLTILFFFSDYVCVSTPTKTGTNIAPDFVSVDFSIHLSLTRPIILRCQGSRGDMNN